MKKILLFICMIIPLQFFYICQPSEQEEKDREIAQAFEKEVIEPTAKVLQKLLQQGLNEKIEKTGTVPPSTIEVLTTINLIGQEPGRFVYHNVNLPESRTFLYDEQNRIGTREFTAAPTAENLYRIVSQKDREINRDVRDERIQTPYATDIRSRLTDAFAIAYNAFEKKHNPNNKDKISWLNYMRYSKDWEKTEGFNSYHAIWYFETAAYEQQKDRFLKEEFEEARIKARRQANIVRKEKKVSLFSIQEPTIFDKISGWFKRTFTTTEGQNYTPRTYRFTRPNFNWARSYIPTKQQVGTILSKTPTSFKPDDNAEKAMRRLEKTGMGYQ